MPNNRPKCTRTTASGPRRSPLQEECRDRTTITQGACETKMKTRWRAQTQGAYPLQRENTSNDGHNKPIRAGGQRAQAQGTYPHWPDKIKVGHKKTDRGQQSPRPQRLQRSSSLMPWKGTRTQGVSSVWGLRCTSTGWTPQVGQDPASVVHRNPPNHCPTTPNE